MRRGRSNTQLWESFKASSFGPCSADSINDIETGCPRLDLDELHQIRRIDGVLAYLVNIGGSVCDMIRQRAETLELFSRGKV